MSVDERVICTNLDGVYEIVLNRPEQHNALSPDMLAKMKQGLLAATGAADVDVIVLRGRGGCFTSGADLRELLELVDDRSKFYVAFQEAFHDAAPYPVMLSSPKTIVSVIDGRCMAAGVVMACASDIVIATDRAEFSIPQARVGLCDPFNPVLLARAIGSLRASYMMMTAAPISASQALSWGLVTSVVRVEDLENEVGNVIDLIRRTSPDARASYKSMINRDLPAFDVDEVFRSALTANGREGLRAFSGRERPQWGPLGWLRDSDDR